MKNRGFQSLLRVKKNNVKDKNDVTQGRKGRMISTREELKNVIELEKKDIQEEV